MFHEEVEEKMPTSKDIIEIFRKNIPSVVFPKKDIKRIKYCQRCGRWLTHYLSENRFDKSESEILQLDKEKEEKVCKWTNNEGVNFVLCSCCYNEIKMDGLCKTDIGSMTMNEFKITYKLTKKKEGKVYDYLKRYNRKI